MRRFWTQSDDATMRDYYPHRPTSEIAAALGRKISTVYQRAQTLGLTKAPRGPIPSSFIESPK